MKIKGRDRISLASVFILLPAFIFIIFKEYFLITFTLDFYDLNKGGFQKVYYQRWFYFFGILLSIIVGILFLLLPNRIIKAKFLLLVLLLYVLSLVAFEIPIYNFHNGHFHSFWELEHWH